MLRPSVSRSGLLGSAYVAVGTTHNLGTAGSPSSPADPASIDGALAGVKQPVFLLDLRDARPPRDAAAWLDQPHVMRAAEPMWVHVVARQAFDAVVFLEQIRSAERVPASDGSLHGRDDAASAPAFARRVARPLRSW